MKRMSKKWLALMLAASLVVSEGSFVSLAQTSANTETTVETGVSGEGENENGTTDGGDVSGGDTVDVSNGDAVDVSAGDVEEDKMFPGVAEGVTLGVNDEARRASLNSNMDKAGDFAEGVDCVENQILVYAETEEIASEYAVAYNGKVEKYYDGLATITLNADETLPKATVKDAVMASAKAENNLPVAWPNTIYHVMPVEEGLTEAVLNPLSVEVEKSSAVLNVAGEEITALTDAEVYASVLGFNDPALSASAGTGYQWFHSAIGSIYAWNAGYTGSGVKVAVIDTGVKLNHEDLKNVTALKVSTLSTLEDTHGHGTHVCGLVGATANNGKGGTGVAPNAAIYSIKAANPDGTFDTDAVWEALSIADSNGVDIINMSLGGASYNEVYEDKIKALEAKGIAVFCATGNEATSAWAYPASYEGSIGIGALDYSMQRTTFSNYGTSTDYAAPGYQIYSSVNTSTAAYENKSGTSMACPIFAGTAAVILQYVRENSVYAESNTVDDVNNLLKIMDKGVVSAGSGTGKGYVSIPKALDLSTSVKAPEAPVFSMKAGTYNEAAITVSITAERGCSIYYSTNGKTPAFKNGEVTDGTLYTGPISVGGNKAVTVKAIAINGSGKLVSKVASVKYSFKPSVSDIVLVVPGNVTSVAKGKSLTIKANVYPDYAANKKVDWKISPEGKGVTVKNGKVAAGKDATHGTYAVTATAQDGGKSATINVTVVEPATNAVTKIQKVSKDNVSLAIGASKQVEVKITKADKSTNAPANSISWSVEDSAVAKVSASATNMITISGVGAGKTNVYGTAADGSGVTLKIPVEVGVGVQSIVLEGGSQLNAGKSITLKAKLNAGEAAPANATLNWTVSPADKGVTVKNGVVKADKTASGAYTITATATDGTNTAGSKQITIISSAISKISLSETKVTLFRVANGLGAETSKTISVTVGGGVATNWDVSSSAPGIVSVQKSGDSIIVSATGNGTGSATITVMATDGSNKKATCKVSVKNPASSLTLGVPGGRSYSVSRGKNVQLKATLGTDFGKLDSSAKKLKWTSSNPNAASVSPSGKVTANSASGYVIITATATDGSGVSASTVIYLVSDIAQIKVLDAATGKYGSATLSVGYYTLIQPELYVTSIVDKYGSFYMDDLTFAVSGNGVGVQPAYDSKGNLAGYYVVANRKGTYTVTVSCTTGCSGKGTFKVTVK